MTDVGTERIHADLSVEDFCMKYRRLLTAVPLLIALLVLPFSHAQDTGSMKALEAAHDADLKRIEKLETKLEEIQKVQWTAREEFIALREQIRFGNTVLTGVLGIFAAQLGLAFWEMFKKSLQAKERKTNP